MRLLIRFDSSRRARVLALLEAAVFVAALIAAPILHRYSCSGVCASPKFATNGETSCGHGCHGASAERHAKTPGGHARGTCNCLDDCCSWHAVFTATDAAVDAGPVTHVIPVPPLRPHDTPRAPGARLLPFPTGPPSAV